MRPNYRAIIISPHLDDAVFSCGGIISQLVTAGPVLVINIFTKYLSDMKFHGVVMGEERHQEELTAAKYLGFETKNLDELDAIFRRKEYRKISNIFKAPVQEDIDWLPILRQKIFAVMNEIDYQQVYVPLGIGWHVDHILTHQVFVPMFGNKKLCFYEDTPYCLIPHTTRYRLNEIASYQVIPNDISLAPINEFRAWRQTSSGYGKTAMMKNLKPWIVRFFASPVVSIFLYRLLASHRKNFNALHKLNLNSRVVDIKDQFDQKLEGMALYGSQFKEFFTSRKDCEDSLKAYAKSMQSSSTKIERYWSVQ